jgi:hypothetical protein
MGIRCLYSDSVHTIKTHSYDTMRFVCSNDSVRVRISAITKTIPRDDIAIMGIYAVLEQGARGHIFHNPRGSTPFLLFCPYPHLTLPEFYSFMVNTLLWNRWRRIWWCRRSTYDLSFLVTSMGICRLWSDSVHTIKSRSYDTLWIVLSNCNVTSHMSAIALIQPVDDTAILGIYTIIDHGARGHNFHDSRGSTPFRPFCPYLDPTLPELYSFMVMTLIWNR